MVRKGTLSHQEFEKKHNTNKWTRDDHVLKALQEKIDNSLLFSPLHESFNRFSFILKSVLIVQQALDVLLDSRASTKQMLPSMNYFYLGVFRVINFYW